MRMTSIVVSLAGRGVPQRPEPLGAVRATPLQTGVPLPDLDQQPPAAEFQARSEDLEQRQLVGQDIVDPLEPRSQAEIGALEPREEVVDVQVRSGERDVLVEMIAGGGEVV